jgi:nitronate monooxygenase
VERYLKQHYDRWKINIETIPEARLRLPFDEEMCAVVEELAPEVVSFHFGLPASSLVDRLKRRGTRIVSSATSVIEAEWLEARGCDAIIAQGYEAGGHRAMFLENDIASQAGLFALLPQISDAVSVPVIAAGGIADARGVVVAFAVGASGVQLGTAYLLCPEANVSPLYGQALSMATENKPALTNLFSGRPARGILNRFLQEAGPMSGYVPAFPYAATLVAPLRAASQRAESLDTCKCGRNRRHDWRSPFQLPSSLATLRQMHFAIATRDSVGDWPWVCRDKSSVLVVNTPVAGAIRATHC